MNVRPATAADQSAWDTFLTAQPFRPFLQSWTMGDVYGDIGQLPVRLVAETNGEITGICFAHVVPAQRGRHLSIPYGPLFSYHHKPEEFRTMAKPLLDALKDMAAQHKCTFIRMSPFLARSDQAAFKGMLRSAGTKVLRSPLHLLAEQVWYLPLTTLDAWQLPPSHEMPMVRYTGGRPLSIRPADDLFRSFRSTTRNLIRRAEKEGVTIRASADPNADLEQHFIRLHDETRKRHGFTPYTNEFFRSQVRRFGARDECTVYLAEYQGQVIASSVHMHAFGETSYHHGASSDAFKKIPASYLLQWKAINDALQRGDQVYNFWGIAPLGQDAKVSNAKHPFAGVTLFKTGFGGNLLELAECMDVPLALQYKLTRAFEQLRKWRRGF